MRPSLPNFIKEAILNLLPGILMVNVLLAQALDSSSMTITARSWASADSLFLGDHIWLGGDAASSIDIGDGRVLWLFGDSFIALDSTSSRRKSTMVRNTVAVQRGYDPSSASIQFYRGLRNNTATDFFKESDDWDLWPRHGVRIGEHLLIVLARVQSVEEGLGFQEIGWTVAVVHNPGNEPPQWNLEFVSTPPSPLDMTMVPATLLRSGEFLYAYMVGGPNPHPVYLARWPANDAAAGILTSPQWWTGNLSRWKVADDSIAKPIRLFDGQTEFSVHYDSTTGKYIQIQTVGFGAADLAFRSADSLQGTWSALQRFYRPPEFGYPEVLIYSARTHVEQQAAGLVVTYNVNSFDFGELVRNSNLYYPKALLVHIHKER